MARKSNFLQIFVAFVFLVSLVLPVHLSAAAQTTLPSTNSVKTTTRGLRPIVHHAEKHDLSKPLAVVAA